MNLQSQEGAYSSGQFMTQEDQNGNNHGNGKRINLSQARKILGVSPNKMSKLIADGTLSYKTDPLDQRVKLVLLEEVERLKDVSTK